MQTLMGTEFTERGGGVSDDRIDGKDLIDCIEFCLVINGSFVGPIDIGNKRRVWLLKMEVLGGHAICAVNGCGTSHAENGVSAGFHYGIIG